MVTKISDTCSEFKSNKITNLTVSLKDNVRTVFKNEILI